MACCIARWMPLILFLLTAVHIYLARTLLWLDDRVGKTISFQEQQADDNRLHQDNQQQSNNATTRSSTPSCLIVYHIPKTGGTSLEEYLKRLAKALPGWRLIQWDAFAASKPYRRPFYRYGGRNLPLNQSFIHEGHLTPNFETMMTTSTTGEESSSCAKMTVLREPVERVISAFYYHDRKDYSEREWRKCLYGKCWLQFEYKNDIVRRFANRGSWWNSFVQKKYVVGNAHNDVSEEALEKAKTRLLSFDRVCFLPQMKACFERFVNDTFGMNMTFPAVMKNRGKTKRMHSISEKLRQEIAEANKWDVSLYQWAMETFRDAT